MHRTNECVNECKCNIYVYIQVLVQIILINNTIYHNFNAWAALIIRFGSALWSQKLPFIWFFLRLFQKPKMTLFWMYAYFGYKMSILCAVFEPPRIRRVKFDTDSSQICKMEFCIAARAAARTNGEESVFYTWNTHNYRKVSFRNFENNIFRYNELS